MSHTSPSQELFLPNDFLVQTLAPKYAIGDRVRFLPMPAEDFGTVTGFQYAPAEHLQDWAWRYPIWLDPQSPSYAWTPSDLAWEADLQRLTLNEFLRTCGNGCAQPVTTAKSHHRDRNHFL